MKKYKKKYQLILSVGEKFKTFHKFKRSHHSRTIKNILRGESDGGKIFKARLGIKFLKSK